MTSGACVLGWRAMNRSVQQLPRYGASAVCLVRFRFPHMLPGAFGAGDSKLLATGRTP